MFSNVTIDVVIGLIFVFVLYSLLATVIEEFLAMLFALRAIMLVKAIRLLLDGRTLYTLSVGSKESISPVLSIFKRRFYAAKESLKHLLCTLPAVTLSRAFYKPPSIKYLAESILSNKPSYVSAEVFSAP